MARKFVRAAAGSDAIYEVMSDGSYRHITRAEWDKLGNPTPGVDPRAGLYGDERNVFEVINGMMAQYGLASLGPKIADFIRQGFSADTINVMLQETPEFKQRFAANQTRIKKGLSPLTPAEYLATEAAYRQVMQAAGLPPGFYDQPADFTRWLENDVSPTEIQTRVQTAQRLIETVDPGLKEQFRQWYTDGDMVAYALDSKRTTEVLQRQLQAAEIGSSAQRMGFSSLSQHQAERLADLGITTPQALEGFSQAEQLANRGSALGAIYGENYGEQDALHTVFFENPEAGEKTRRLASQERAAFSGTGGADSQSLSRTRQGQV